MPDNVNFDEAKSNSILKKIMHAVIRCSFHLLNHGSELQTSNDLLDF